MDMILRWFGTASVALETERGKLLWDPFVPLKRAENRTEIEEYDGYTDIFVTHGHFDHIAHLPAVIRRNPKARIWCTDAPYATLRKKGVPAANLVRIGFGETLDVQGFAVRTYHGRHAVLPRAGFSRVAYALKSPARGNLFWIAKEAMQCHEEDETVLYEVSADGVRVCLMGSLNIREGAELPKDPDVLVLPYNGWEDNFPPAAAAIEAMRPKRVLLDHYDDSFPPLTQPLDLGPILDAYPGIVEALKTEQEFVI
jgi:L-ascorbate metabolism protein UlaG (beta-lactamase superfamily)